MTGKKMTLDEARKELLLKPIITIGKGSCDATGKTNYPHLYQSHPHHSVAALQNLLIAAGYLDDIPDGVIGKKGHGAIERFFASHGLEGEPEISPNEHTALLYDEATIFREQTPTDRKVLIEKIPHVSQWTYPYIEITPERTVVKRDAGHDPILDGEGEKQYVTIPSKSVREIGCLSCCVDLIHSHSVDGEVDIDSFVRNGKAFQIYDSGDEKDIRWDDAGRIVYDPGGDIQWDEVEALTGLTHAVDIGIGSGKESLDEGDPVILRVRTGKGFHFVVGIGYDEEGFHCHDVGSWRGNAYSNPMRRERPGQTFVKYEEVTRVDSLS